MERRLCLECTHCVINYDGGYSDMTPGSGIEVACYKGHFSLDRQHEISRTWLRDKLRLAQTCEDYELDPVLKRGEN